MNHKTRFIELLNDELKNVSNKIDVGKFGEFDFPVDWFDLILDYKKDLDKILAEITKRLKKAPSGRLRANAHGGKFHYFQINNKNDSHGSYIPRKDIKLAEKLAQKGVDEKSIVKLDCLSRNLDKIIECCNPKRYDQIYLSCHARQALITPIRYPDEIFEKIWSSVNFIRKPFEPNSTEIFTHDGMRVRSKSEVIIAETLTRMKIPFRYECPLKLKGVGVVHPDFVCLDAHRRSVRIWEHFGMVDKCEYAENMVRRINAYQNSGFFLGNGLIATYETAECPLNASRLNEFVSIYFGERRTT